MSTQFTWWRRFYPTQKIQPNQMFKGASKLLQRIEAGEFEADGLWEQSYLEEEISKNEFEDFKKKNPNASQDLYDVAEIDIRKKRNKRMNVMRDNHIKNEMNLLYKLKNELLKEYNIDQSEIWDLIENFDGTTRELYFYLGSISRGETPKTKEQVANIPILFEAQPRHILKRAHIKHLPSWRKILLKYNFHSAYPYE